MLFPSQYPGSLCSSLTKYKETHECVKLWRKCLNRSVLSIQKQKDSYERIVKSKAGGVKNTIGIQNFVVWSVINRFTFLNNS